MLLIDNTVKKVPIACNTVDTPYLSGEIEAQCLPDAITTWSLVMFPASGPADDPDSTWQEVCAATTRAQAKKEEKSTPLRVPNSRESPVVDTDILVKMQIDDDSLKSYRNQDGVMVKGEKEISFEVKNGVLYRIFKHPHVNNGKPMIQVMLPSPLRRQLMELAHQSIMGEHTGIKKTTDKILSAFYWPGTQGDVSRHCRSCDVCQKTVNKGFVPKVPLQMTSHSNG